MGVLKNAPHLAEVKPNHNNLSIISCKAFGNLPSLTFLDLSYNKIKYVSFLSILNSPNLVLLNIQKNNLQDYSSKIDLPLNVKVQIVLTDEYYLCCISSTITKCFTENPWYFSCSTIFLKKYVKMSVYFVCTFLFSTNLVSLLLHRFSSKSNSFCYHKIITVINLIDITYGIYLMILLIGDNFFPHELIWKPSSICFVVNILFLNFTISSPSALCFFTLCRLMVTKFPLDTKLKNPKYTLKCIVCSFIASSLFTIIISILMQYIFYLSSPFCTNFANPSKSVLLVKIVRWFIVLYKFLATGTILVMYIVLLYDLQTSQMKCQKVQSLQVSILAQIVVTIIANTLTWIPSGIIHILTMTLRQYLMELVLWTVIGIEPINSVVNPFIFIITTVKK